MQLQNIRPRSLAREVIGHEELFIDLHDHLPKEMVYERELLICRLYLRGSISHGATR
jgi:phosphoenolpyruvate carboxykinase (GTP)